MSNSIRISSLDNLPVVVSVDFIPVVQSGSLTTYRTNVGTFLNLVASSGSVLSASWASSSFNSTYSISSSFASASLISISSLWASSSINSVSSSWASSSVSSISSSWASSSMSSISSSWASSSVSSISSSWASQSLSASFSNSSLSSSYSKSSSFANSSSFAVTASFASSTGATFGISFLDTPVFVVVSPLIGWGNSWYKYQGGISEGNWNGPSASVADTVIKTNTNTFVGPTVFHTSQAGVPAGAKAVILDGAIGSSWPDGQYDWPTYLTIRKTSISVDLLLVGTTTLNSGNAGQNSAAQGIFPLAPDGTFYWCKQGIGGNWGYNIRLIGYIT